MIESLFNRHRRHYVLVMFLFTRVFAFVGGGLVVYYVNLTFDLSPQMQSQFESASAILIALAVVVTVAMAVLETREIREALRRLDDGEPVPLELLEQAGQQAVLFPGRHVTNEAIVDPFVTAVPLCLYLYVGEAAPPLVLLQILIAGFLGISTVLLATFFICERWLEPVVRCLLDHQAPIDFAAISPSRLHKRMIVSFGIIIINTALVIGAIASQRAQEIVRNPLGQHDAVANLQEHILYIVLTAVTVGVFLSRMLANSVASRVANLVQAMRRVESGSLAERVHPTGNDEIDTLARQFNAMVEQLDRNDQLIRDLNVNLEEKVRRRTRQLQRSKHSLQQSLKKLQEYDQLKTEFFSNVSHELRTPLTMILAPIDRILKAHAQHLPPDVSSHLRVMRVNSHRLLDQINRLLEFSKLEAGRTELNLEACDLNTLVRELTAAAEPLAEQRGLRLQVALDPSIPLFGADEEKIDTVLSNLISNALKFTPAGGIVEVKTSRSAHQVTVSVTDTGIGIPPSDYERIFERFVQLDGSNSRAFSGTGLGLALARELIELHGGEIHVESEPGQGSSFWFTLPLTELPTGNSDGGGHRRMVPRFVDLLECGTETADAAPPLPAASAASPKLLVTDDTPEMRSLLGDLLSDYYRVVFACDGVEGLEVARREQPDLIISDVMMPNMDGYEFCRCVKQDPAMRQIPFVMLTAKAELSMKIEGLNCGADDYLVKPFDAEELQARVRSLLKMRTLNQELDHRNVELESTLQTLRSTQSQLVHSEKMSSLGQLVAGIAHELNNSINAVYNGIQPLHKRARTLESLVRTALDRPDAPCDPTVRKDIETTFQKISTLAGVIESGATRTARIVGDLKTFSHPGNEAPELFDLGETLDMCLNLLSNQMKHRVTVHCNYTPMGRIYAPWGKLNQVFLNLLANAEQAMPEGGDIFIETRQERERIVIAIRDTGTGIPENLRNRIFDPFFTTKPPGVGTGLGRSISYGIITQLEGTIECRSEPGQGTEFIIRLPVPGSPTETATSRSDAVVATAEGATK